MFCLSSYWIDGLFFVSLLVVCSVITHAPVPVQRLFEAFFHMQQNFICSWISWQVIEFLYLYKAVIQGANSREVPESCSKLLLFGNLIKKIIYIQKKGVHYQKTTKKYSVVKVFFFFSPFKCGNGGKVGKGERGSTRASQQRSWERGSESSVLTDYLSEEDRPILPNRDCPSGNKLLRGFTVFVILGQCQQWSLKKPHMTVRTKRG